MRNVSLLGEKTQKQNPIQNVSLTSFDCEISLIQTYSLVLFGQWQKPRNEKRNFFKKSQLSKY